MKPITLPIIRAHERVAVKESHEPNNGISKLEVVNRKVQATFYNISAVYPSLNSVDGFDDEFICKIVSGGQIFACPLPCDDVKAIIEGNGSIKPST